MEENQFEQELNKITEELTKIQINGKREKLHNILEVNINDESTRFKLKEILKDDDIVGKIDLNNFQDSIPLWKSPFKSITFIIIQAIASIAFLYLIYTSYYKTCIFNKLFDFILYIIGTIGPPLYFLVEYIHLFKYKLDSNQLADIKYTQELASKVWAACVIIAGFLLMYKYDLSFFSKCK